jgi:nucleoside 2-deoxyribosyltransferase
MMFDPHNEGDNDMNKVYLAARYSRRLELCGYRAQLESIGFVVTSRWLNGAHQIDHDGKPIGDHGEKLFEEGTCESADAMRARFVTEDVTDVKRADIVIAFTEEPRSGHSRGGRHVELGLAIAWNKDIYVVGPCENLFCYLPQISVVTWESFLRDYAHLYISRVATV